jgi:hypothetical protein
VVCLAEGLEHKHGPTILARIVGPCLAKPSTEIGIHTTHSPRACRTFNHSNPKMSQTPSVCPLSPRHKMRLIKYSRINSFGEYGSAVNLSSSLSHGDSQCPRFVNLPWLTDIFTDDSWEKAIGDTTNELRVSTDQFLVGHV